jgi:hypothetical protein
MAMCRIMLASPTFAGVSQLFSPDLFVLLPVVASWKQN